MGISGSPSRTAADRTGQGVPPESDRPWSIETNGIEPIAQSEHTGAAGGSSMGVLIALIIGALVYLILALATGQRPYGEAAATTPAEASR